jgi:putative transposase
MPRGPRLDAPGVLHHVMARGIERGRIFRDDHDRDDFVDRLVALVEDAAVTVYAWALIPNHFHLLVRTERRPLSRSMRSLLTGYAGAFNRRHGRSGHLFQNRYKSIVCEQDAYFLELVRYLHLNPLRAGFVGGLRELEVELAKNYRLSRTQLGEIEQIIEVHYDEFTSAWQRHLSS